MMLNSEINSAYYQRRESGPGTNQPLKLESNRGWKLVYLSWHFDHGIISQTIEDTTPQNM